MALAADAQSMYDALTLSENNYNGTARSIALGNAMTAVGGDLGSITLNPAGSAVANYSQFTLTPNISISSYSSKGGVDGFSDTRDSRHTRFNVYNAGAILNFDTGNSYGIRSFSFGFVANSTANYLSDMYASGVQGQTSFLGSYAVAADGYACDVLGGNNAFYSTAPWRAVLGYQSGMISTYNGLDNQYVGATERVYDDGSIETAGDILQRYGRVNTGNKTDMLLNFGMNVNNKLYLGANLGLVSVSYSSDAYIKETAVNTDDFLFSYADGTENAFKEARVRESLAWDASGVYGKIGAIYTPGGGVRLGAAIQTPTAMTINETYQMDGYTHYVNSAGNAKSSSPVNEYTYRLTSPFRFNVGAAWTFSNILLVSADYEMADYSAMRFRTHGPDADQSEFDWVNADIRDFMGVSHMLRLGGEVKPLPELALRVGYNLQTNPEKLDDGSYVGTNRHSVGLGVGYSSKGSFFADVALRGSFLPDEYIRPYADYITDDAGNVTVFSPEIHNTASVWDIACTIGWRF